MGPPEWILLKNLELLELRANSPTLVISQSVTILLEQSVDPRDTPVPTVLQVFEGQTTILGVCFLTFQRILGPDTLRVDKLRFPWLNVPVQVRDQLILVVAHTRAEVGDSNVSLLGPSQIRLQNEKFLISLCYE